MNLSRVNKNFNLQYIISYLGILPFIYISIDIFFFNIFALFFLKDFIIYYSLIIFTFIGAMRWSFYQISDPLNILYGFLPSFISTFLILFNLLNYNKNLLLLYIFLFFILQLIGDVIFNKQNNSFENIFFIKVRLPATSIILINIFYLIFV